MKALEIAVFEGDLQIHMERKGESQAGAQYYDPGPQNQVQLKERGKCSPQEWIYHKPYLPCDLL